MILPPLVEILWVPLFSWWSLTSLWSARDHEWLEPPLHLQPTHPLWVPQPSFQGPRYLAVSPPCLCTHSSLYWLTLKAQQEGAIIPEMFGELCTIINKSQTKIACYPEILKNTPGCGTLGHGHQLEQWEALDRDTELPSVRHSGWTGTSQIFLDNHSFSLRNGLLPLHLG